MSKFWKVAAVVGAVGGAVALCVFCPPVSATVGKVAMACAPSVGEIIAEEGHWPL